MVEVVFTKKYANKEKDDVGAYDGMIASSLVRVLKVAKYKKKSKSK